ncbi:MAG: ABC transporter ATP-binding protein [Bosea sp.]|uniref:ABC transporter ATP-binding protein n=1 Tax=Bosea sp. (in: a-proteobacteria) TaxID=1871050 RepID=UPI001ACB524C|nr:ABC transporter ATP-binding protein [Bosea sp. (in: a-proteobacteria)]MBN9467174.1 ABC transporter ATP-binding protein [Bosea sp. (in: a-proteobacteria)]
MLTCDNLSAGYGGADAIRDVSLRVDAGDILGVVGPNGAGKTTLLRAISGSLQIAKGKVVFNGTDITAMAPHRRPGLGLAHVPEGRQVFGELTVAENLSLGATTLPAGKSREERLAFVYDLFPRLAERRGQLAGTMSGGEQQMVAIGRGLMMDPKLLLLDEPSMGLAPKIVTEIFASIVKLGRTFGLTVLIAEQRLSETLASCNKCVVIASGQITASGEREAIVRSGAIEEAYFGT